MPDNNYDDIDTPYNKYMVSMLGDKIAILKPPQYMTCFEAEEFAAWIVALCDTNMA